MAACTPVRIDHQDFNGGNQQDVTRGIANLADGAEGSAYFVYANRTTVYNTSVFDEALYFRKYDHATQTMGTPVQIAIAAPGTNMRNPNFKRLDSGRLIVTYLRSTVGIEWCFSDDNGATWSAPALISVGVLILEVGQSGDELWMAAHVSGSITKTYQMFKYSGGFWTNLGTFFLGTFGVVLYVRDQGGASPKNAMFFFDTPGHMLMILEKFTPASPWTLQAWRSIDGGVSWSPAVTIYTSSGSTFQPLAWSEKVSSTRVVSMWTDTNGSFSTLFLGYSDDEGQTWTSVGEITDFGVLNGAHTLGANDQSWSFDVISSTRIVVGAAFLSPTQAVWAMAGPIAQTGWGVIQDCDPQVSGYPNPISKAVAPSNLGQSFRFGADFVFCFHMAWTNQHEHPADVLPTDSYYTYDFELIPDVFDTTPPPCIVIPTAEYIIGDDGTATICGPEWPDPLTPLYTYAWTGPGGFTATTRCITVSEPGTYNLTVTSLVNGLPSFCTGIVLRVPEQPPPTEVIKGKPFRRGDLPLEPSGHPAGNPAIKRVGD
jgi:hypothetical protein